MVSFSFRPLCSSGFSNVMWNRHITKPYTIRTKDKIVKTRLSLWNVPKRDPGLFGRASCWKTCRPATPKKSIMMGFGLRSNRQQPSPLLYSIEIWRGCVMIFELKPCLYVNSIPWLYIHGKKFLNFSKWRIFSYS